MKTTNWLALGLAMAFLLIIGLALGTGLLGYCYPGGMMGPWGTGWYPSGMMGGWIWGLSGLMVMFLMWLVPITFVALLVLGLVWLVQAISKPGSQPPVTAATCPECHKNVQADWQHCPYCGRKLK